jgi:hypothetical protein
MTVLEARKGRNGLWKYRLQTSEGNEYGNGEFVEEDELELAT